MFESPRGRGIGRCGIGDYGIEKLSSIGQNGDDGEFLLKKDAFNFPPRKRDLSKDIYIFKNSFRYAAQKARTACASETMPLP